MILTFQKRFVQPILDGTKIHTIRVDDYNRWKVGMKIHFWCGNPRNPSNLPYQFAEGKVKYVRHIEIFPNNYVEGSYGNIIWEKVDDLDILARDDGFKDWEEMKQFFSDYFEGKLIIWEQPIKGEQP